MESGGITVLHILKINGRDREFAEGQLPEMLSELLEKMDINAATVVAEINGEIVAQENFTTTRVTPGQSIELVRFVGGG